MNNKSIELVKDEIKDSLFDSFLQDLTDLFYFEIFSLAQKISPLSTPTNKGSMKDE